MVKLLLLVTELRKRGVSDVELEGPGIAEELGISKLKLSLLPDDAILSTVTRDTQQILDEIDDNPNVDSEAVAEKIQQQTDQDFYHSS